MTMLAERSADILTSPARSPARDDGSAAES
jgi:hypothetical protein